MEKAVLGPARGGADRPRTDGDSFTSLEGLEEETPHAHPNRGKQHITESTADRYAMYCRVLIENDGFVCTVFTGIEVCTHLESRGCRG